jgi:hypothetical protein
MHGPRRCVLGQAILSPAGPSRYCVIRNSDAAIWENAEASSVVLAVEA